MFFDVSILVPPSTSKNRPKKQVKVPQKMAICSDKLEKVENNRRLYDAILGVFSIKNSDEKHDGQQVGRSALKTRIVLVC